VVGPAVTVQNTYEPLRDVLASKENMKTAGGTLVSGYTYAVNSLGQRTSVQQAGSAFAAPAFNVYGYDSLGQVTSAKRTGGTLAEPIGPVAGQQFVFTYDTIGNRKTATDGNATTAYTANPLNQYTSVNTAVPTYDLDGNLLADGTHTCEWDGENRLIKVTSGGTIIANSYDALSRRVRRTVTNGTTVTSDTGYVCDGWNVIAEYNLASGTPALTAVNTWGLDLSNSRQGAGGVGGLLSRTTGGTTQSYTFDGNGNVSELVTNAGSVAGHYEYGPFGQTTVQTDSDATGAVASNPYRFSTKPLDVGSGLYYYGYRYYNPIDGRWINRDPIGEVSFFQQYVTTQEQDAIDGLLSEELAPMYLFSKNSPVNLIDKMGLEASIAFRIKQDGASHAAVDITGRSKCHKDIYFRQYASTNGGTFDLDGPGELQYGGGLPPYQFKAPFYASMLDRPGLSGLLSDSPWFVKRRTWHGDFITFLIDEDTGNALGYVKWGYSFAKGVYSDYGNGNYSFKE